MSIKKQGIVYTVVATILFGITPVIGKASYALGNNGIQLALLRHLFVLPIFFIIVKCSHLSLKLTSKQAQDVFKVGFFGNTITIVLLYSSYSYMSVGSATVLHFLYPLFVCVLNFIFYQQKLNKKQLLCLILAMLGIFCFIEKTSSSMIGFFLSIISGMFFAYYMVEMDHSSIREISPFVFNFYLVLLNVFAISLLALVTHSYHSMPPLGFVYSFVVAILTSFIAVILLQKGIYCLGASLTAILSTLEPITSLLVGMLLLHESLSLLKFVGCFFVLTSTVLLVLSQKE